MNENLAMYHDSKDAITTLITEENQHVPIPACPKWTLRDMLGHLAGSIEDFHSGNIDGFGTSTWTAAQVDRYRDLSLTEMKDRWDAIIAEMGDAFAAVGENDLPDIGTHEFDVRGALGNTENRDAPILEATLRFLVEGLDEKFDAMSLPPLRLIADDLNLVVGNGEPVGEIRTSVFEATRVMTGRRSAEQIRQLDWTGNAAQFVNDMSLMTPRSGNLVE